MTINNRSNQTRTGDGDSVGAVLVEHTIILPLFIVLLAVSFDLMRISYNALTAQFVAAKVLREATTGSVSPPELEQRIIGLAGGLNLSLAPVNISFCSIELSPCVGITPAESGDVVVLTIFVPLSGFIFGRHIWQLSERSFPIHALVVGRMEPL